jgi:hypothetical protein
VSKISQIPLSHVFTPGGLPSITYVSRDHLELEKKLSDAIARGFAFIVVTGPTKSGKTVLCRRVLERDPLIVVEGGQIRTEADFWSNITHQLSIAAQTTRSRGETAGTSVTGEAGGSLAGFFQAKTGLAQADTTQSTSTFSFTNISVLAALDRLIKDKITLMVDDFHYVEHDTQKAIIRAVKGAVFKGLRVVFLAVPHRAFDPIMVESEVEGRFKHIAIPQWALDDLILIPNRGFSALNIEVKRASQRRICQDSFGNPLLVQEICSEFCLANGVREAATNPREMDMALLESTYRQMAENRISPTYEKLRRGPEGRRARQLRPLRRGGKEDIYTAILAAVARLGPRASTTFEEIRGSLRTVFAPDVRMPTKAELYSGLTNMSDIAKHKVSGEPPLEWVGDTDRLEIIDPFLLFWLRWSLRNQSLFSTQDSDDWDINGNT